jgi:hypothetical protein
LEKTLEKKSIFKEILTVFHPVFRPSERTRKTRFSGIKNGVFYFPGTLTKIKSKIDIQT